MGLWTMIRSWENSRLVKRPHGKPYKDLAKMKWSQHKEVLTFRYVGDKIDNTY